MSSTPPAASTTDLWLTEQSAKVGRVSGMRRRRRLRAVAVTGVITLAAMMMASSPARADNTTPSPTSSEHSPTTFIMGIKQDIDSLNPYVGVVVSAYDAYQLMYDTLTEPSAKDMSPVPALAESWDTSPDGRTWTFHLRHGVKWSDGQDLTADDVVYTFQRAMNGDTENGQYGSYVDVITKVTKVDDYTVSMQTKQPSPSMLNLEVPILPEHIWKSISEKQVGTYANDDHPVGSGPFQLVEAKKGQFYRFVANKNYWRGAPKIDQLVFRVFADEETMVQALKKGDIDFAEDLTAPRFNALKGDPTITLHSGPSTYVYEIGFNNGAATVDNKPIGNGNPALRNKLVRQAIDYAIDKKALVDKVLLGHGSVATGEIPPVYPAYHWSPTPDQERTFDPAKANQLLDQAGYPRGPDGVRVGPDGKKLELRLFGRSNNEDSKKTVEYVRDWLKDVGITAVVSIMSEDQLTDVIGKGNYDMFQWDWAVEPDPDFQLSVFTCDQRSTEDGGAISAGWSDSFYCNSAYDQLYQKQKTIIDVAQRADVVKQAQQMIYDDAAYAVLWYGQTLEAYRNDRFTGFVEQPASGGSLADQFGTYSYRLIEPYHATAASKSTSSKLGLTLGIGGGVLVLLVAVGMVTVARRRGSADERE